MVRGGSRILSRGGGGGGFSKNFDDLFFRSAKNGFLKKYQRGDPLGRQGVESLRGASAPPLNPPPPLNMTLIVVFIFFHCTITLVSKGFSRGRADFQKKKSKILAFFLDQLKLIFRAFLRKIHCENAVYFS